MKQTLENRYKILFFLTVELNVLSEQMDELAIQISNKNPQAEEALTHFENEIIKILEK